MTAPGVGARSAVGRGGWWLAWALALVPTGLATAGLGLAAWLGVDGFGDRVSDALIYAVPYPLVGALVVAREPRNAVGWILGAIGTLQAVDGFLEVFARAGLAGSTPVADVLEVVYLPDVAMLLLFVFLPLLFPTGRPPSPRWRVVAWAGAAGLFLLPAATTAERVAARQGAAPGWLLAVSWGVAILFALGGGAAAAAAVVVRFRRARGIERQQLKWFVLGVAVSLLVTASFFTPLGRLDWLLSFVNLSVPTAIGVAVLRYRLYDVDRLINRGLVYGGLTAVLALLYLTGVVVFQRLLGPLTEGSDLAVAGSTLVVAALVRPLRSRIQAGVDRRFYRRRYDAGRAVEAFRDRLRDEVDLDALGRELAAAVDQAVQPAHLGLWLRPGMEPRR